MTWQRYYDDDDGNDDDDYYYFNLNNIFIWHLLQEHKMLIERGYVLLHKIKVQQSRKIRKSEKKT